MFSFLRKTVLWVILLPWALTYTGAALNQFVLLANHDKFPVMMNPYKTEQWKPDANGMIDDTHCVMTDKTHLNLLGDWIDLHTATYSIGDLLLELGEFIWTFAPYVWATLVIKKLM